LFYCPGTPENAWVEIPIEVKRKEPLRLLINAACAPDYGRYQASLDGVRLGGVLDFYADNLTDKEFHLLDFWPEPGVYTLRLDCIGKSAKSEGWNLGLESVRLRERRPRVEKYGHDKDNDWRKNPLFYTK
jgi:glycosidase